MHRITCNRVVCWNIYAAEIRSREVKLNRTTLTNSNWHSRQIGLTILDRDRPICSKRAVYMNIVLAIACDCQFASTVKFDVLDIHVSIYCQDRCCSGGNFNIRIVGHCIFNSIYRNIDITLSTCVKPCICGRQIAVCCNCARILTSK